MEQHKALHRAVCTALLEREPTEGLRARFAPDHRFHVAPLPELPAGAEGFERLASLVRDAVAEGYVRVEGQVADAARVSTRLVAQVRVAGPVGPVHLGSTWVELRLVVLSRVREGLLTDTFVESNLFQVLNRVGGLDVLPGALVEGDA